MYTLSFPHVNITVCNEMVVSCVLHLLLGAPVTFAKEKQKSRDNGLVCRAHKILTRYPDYFFPCPFRGSIGTHVGLHVSFLWQVNIGGLRKLFRQEESG